MRNDARFDSAIANCMTESQWYVIKCHFKELNINYEEAARGTDGYNPCAKFDYIFQCLVHNMNYCTVRADLNQTIDELTWGFAGYSGEAGGCLMNKPVKKGECCAMLCNSTLFLMLSQLPILRLMHCDCHSSIAIIMLARWTNNHLNRHPHMIPTWVHSST
jgi:hypothetical protein